MGAPAVSVLIIVLNRAHTIGAAVRSVLAQTFTDLELVVVDDGSTDGTAEVVKGFTDPRVRLVRSDRNEGIPKARNRALEQARGRFIAWLDSDDLCHPERLAVQKNFLDRRPDIAMVGSAARRIDAESRLLAGGRVSVRSHERIRALLLFRSAFQQSSIFGRAEALRTEPYDPDFPVCEDVDMFARFTQRHRAENLPQFLIARRLHPGQTIRRNVDLILERQMAITARLLAPLELTYTPEELRNHVILGGCFDGRISDAIVGWAEGWFARIEEANARQLLYDQAALRACFQLVLLKAALRRARKKPAQVGKLLDIAGRHPDGAAALIRDLGLTVVPFGSRPSAAGFRPVLKA